MDLSEGELLGLGTLFQTLNWLISNHLRSAYFTTPCPRPHPKACTFLSI